jgi:hypothetical protein
MDSVQWANLKRVFKATMDHFNLPADVRAVAWQSAQECPVKALACYSAIVNSLKGR